MSGFLGVLVILGALATFVWRVGRAIRDLIRRPWRVAGLSWWSAIVWMAAVLIPIFAQMAVNDRDPVAGAVAVLTAALLFAWWCARWIFIPLGLVRISFWFGRFAEFTWRRDRTGGALLAAAWALARRRRTRPETLAWLETRVNDANPTRGAALVAAGLLCAYRGDDEGAAALMESMETLPAKTIPNLARRVAREWLAARAASVGDWDRVLAIARRRGPRSRATMLLAACGARFGGAPAWHAALLLRWLYAPHRLATWPIVQRALIHAALPPPWEEAEEKETPGIMGDGPYRTAAPGEDRPLSAALAKHLAILSSARPLTKARLRAAATTWDRALAGTSSTRLVADRAFILGTTDCTQTLPTMVEAVKQDLAALALAAELPLDAETVPGAAILGAVTQIVREKLLADVEAVARALEQRIRGERLLGAIDEWREWTHLRLMYERAGRLGGLPVRRLVYANVHDAVCPLAVRLWNKLGQRALADTIFAWLLAEAQAVGNERLVAHEKKNVACAS